MSSILDALERAEKERNQLDRTPFMETGTTGSGLLQRRGLWVFTGLLLMINLLIWLWVAVDPEQTSEAPAEASVQSAPRQPLATAKTVVSILEQPQAGKERKSDPPLVVEALVAEKDVMSEPSPPAASSVVTDSAVSSQPAVTARQPEKVAKTEQSIEPTGPDRIATEAQTTLAKVSESRLPAEQSVRKVQQEVEQDETEQIPSLWELPPNVQEKLSDLKINILVYDEDAERRFVIINMRKYRQGDRLVPSGMQLERITRKGVVIDYGDGLVRL